MTQSDLEILKQKAVQRVKNDPDLSKPQYYNIIIDLEWDHEEYWEWLVEAPWDEIYKWAIDEYWQMKDEADEAEFS